MHSPETYQLRIATQSAQVKEDIRDWLIGNGEEAFVEGSLDDLFEDPSYEVTAYEQFENLGGQLQPIFVYKYDEDHLKALQSDLIKAFGSALTCEISVMATETWMEGWKESFQPIRTESFYIYPPWLVDNIPADLIPIEIEPGMAFGTGQHATTVLCLEALEKFHASAAAKDFVLDVGTGTGILAIGAAKLGFSRVIGTDIDIDAVGAARENAKQNGVELELNQASVPDLNPKADIVIANIIFFVLKQIIGELSAQVAPGGLLILSGLLAEEMRDMEKFAIEEQLVLVSETTREDWACQVYRRTV